MKKPASLFSGVFPCGISYADRSRERDGDYAPVAFLSFDTLRFEVRDPKSPLLEQARADAAKLQARRGEEYPIDACGHTVTLGGR